MDHYFLFSRGFISPSAKTIVFIKKKIAGGFSFSHSEANNCLLLLVEGKKIFQIQFSENIYIDGKKNIVLQPLFSFEQTATSFQYFHSLVADDDFASPAFALLDCFFHLVSKMMHIYYHL